MGEYFNVQVCMCSMLQQYLTVEVLEPLTLGDFLDRRKC